jgi:phenylacetate-CoA ligase
LTRQALPLIRYRTHDITRVISRDLCRCGRTSLRLERFSCRTDDMLKVKGVNLYPRQIESLFLSHPEIGNDYLIVIDRVKGADQLAVNVEARELHWPDWLGRQLSEELYSMLGLHAEVSILQPGALPRPEGKAVRVDDRRK